jgi:hypothetical protein
MTVNICQPKVKGRPRSKVSFAKKCKVPVPLKFEKWPSQKQASFLLTRCVINEPLDEPYDIDNIKSLELMHSACAHEKAHLSLIEVHFESAAWDELVRRTVEKREKDVNKCLECNELDNGAIMMIECESCLAWYHYACVGIRSQTKPTVWFCTNSRGENQSVLTPILKILRFLPNFFRDTLFYLLAKNQTVICPLKHPNPVPFCSISTFLNDR